MPHPFKLVASAFESVLPLPVQQRRIAEGVRAAVADPYWMLGRQWALCEFRGSSGGSLLELDVRYRTTELTLEGDPPDRIGGVPLQARIESASDALDEESALAGEDDDIPLDAEIEVRHLAAPPAWQKDAGRLEYAATLVGSSGDPGLGTTTLVADQYEGGGLDWYELRAEQLDATPVQPADLERAQHLKVRPTAVTFAGMPRARFLEFEDSEVHFGDLARPHNFLSVMLMELGLCYSNDWFIAQLPQPCNTVRRILRVRVRDVFDPPLPVDQPEEGRELPPHENRDELRFQMFALEHSDDRDGTPSSSSYHLLTDVHPAIHAGPSLEEVVFFRDETANLAWSVERIARARPIAEPAATDGARPQPAGDPAVRRYRALELPPRSYIPYRPVPRPDRGGEVRLRRGRSVIDPFDRQYETQLVGEAALLCEDEIPGAPVAVLQQPRLACLPAPAPGSDAPFAYYLWVGRRKRAAPKLRGGRLRFDVIE